MCWLREHTVPHHKLAVQFQRPKWTYRHCWFARADQTTLRSVSGKVDTEEQARKNAEEVMTNVAKNLAISSAGRSALLSHRNDLIKEGGWTKEAVEKGPREAPDDLVDTTSEKGRPARK